MEVVVEFVLEQNSTCTEFTVQKGRSFDIYVPWMLLSVLKFAELRTETEEKWLQVVKRGESESVETFFHGQAFVRKTKAGSLANSSGQCKGHGNICYYSAIFCWALTVLLFESRSHSATNYSLSVCEINTHRLHVCVQNTDQIPDPLWCKHSLWHLSAKRLNTSQWFIASLESAFF